MYKNTRRKRMLTAIIAILIVAALVASLLISAFLI